MAFYEYEEKGREGRDPVEIAKAGETFHLPNVSAVQNGVRKGAFNPLTASKIIVMDANKVISSGTNSDAEVSAAVTASHTRSHSITGTSDHTSSATAGQMLKADANGLPVDATNTDAQVSGAVTASHTRSHAITGTSDHTSSATSGRMLKADANGLPVDATNTDTDVSDAVTKKHTQNTDTGSSNGWTFTSTAVTTYDNSSADTAYIPMILYDNDSSVAANSVPIGTLRLQYTP